MPNTKSAAKAYRQSLIRHGRNLAKSRAYKGALKEFRKMAGTDAKAAKALLADLQQALDKAAKGGVIKKNKAARLKSRAVKLLVKSSK